MRTVNLKQIICDELLADIKGYLDIVGSLNYLAQFSTKPDILFSVSVLVLKCSHQPINHDVCHVIQKSISPVFKKNSRYWLASTQDE
jgi:hypothetical protein